MQSASLPAIFSLSGDNGAQALVTAGWDSAQGYASTAFSESLSFLNTLQAAAADLADIGDIPYTVGSANTIIGPYVAPVPPTPDDLNPAFPVAPLAPTLGTVSLPTFAEAPVFDGVMPAINTDIAVPSPLSAAVPNAPTLNPIDMPDELVVTLPDVPTLYALNIPAAPVVDLPLFNATLGDAPVAPDVAFSFTEPEYVSSLKTAIEAKLGTWLAGAATGIDPDVEQAIYERARVREVVNAAQAVDNATRQFGARGFDLPSGVLVDNVLRAQQELQDKSSSLSRDIMIKQADLEQKNMLFAIEQGIRYDGILIDYANKVAQRAYETSRYLVESAIQVFNAKVSLFNASVQAYAAEASVFKDRVQAALATLEIYKAELEGQRIIGQINTQLADIYKSELEAVNTTVAVYRERLNAVRTKVDIDARQIEVFRVLVSAYDSQVRAKASEFDMYANQIRAELSKVEVYTSQANAYESVVKGFVATTEAKKTVAELELEVNQKMPLEVYKGLLGAYTEQVQAEGIRIKAIADVFNSKTQLFSAEVSGETGRVDSETKAYTAEINALVAEAGLGIEAAKAKLQATITSAAAMIEAIKGGAQASAQLAASALSAVNLSGSISDQQSISNSVSANMQASAQNVSDYQEVHYYKES